MTTPMVVKEFIRCRIAPLQRHSRQMWTFSGYGDRMRLQAPALPPEARRTMLELLTGDPMPTNLPEEGCLLYCCSNKVEFVKQMPLFDEWGLCPAGLDGPHENPILVVPLPAAAAARTPEVDAGGECRRTPMRWLLLKEQRRAKLPRWLLPRLGLAVLRQGLRNCYSLKLPRSPSLRPQQMPGVQTSHSKLQW